MMKKIFLMALLVLMSGTSWVFSKNKPDFVLWQLPSQVNTIGNSYVFRMDDGKVVVMDGGVKAEAAYLRGFLAALGNQVDVWFVSHPHPDHIGALNEILKAPGDIKIGKIFLSEFSPAFCELEPEYKAAAVDFYNNLKKSQVPVVNVTQPGMVIQIDRTKFKILSVTNEDLTTNPYNNSSMVIRAWDSKKSILFLGDAGREEGDRLLKGPFRKDLDCDYLQMAHHGQKGVSKDFYRTIKFSACLWPSPSWVYNNDAGKGYNTHTFETVEIRNLVDSLGIKKNYVSCKGLCKIE
ncbi:MAG: MBL fold metallo-hydrolase [Bacteroidota bacterium]|nr:MBL fold metallo-hydrolase [Bacteroidota bacterium]